MASSNYINGSGGGGGTGADGINVSIEGPVPIGFAVDYSTAQGLCVENVQAHP